MPELPEVEVTRQSFASRIEGACVMGVMLGKPLRWPLGIDPQALVGARVGATVRRGKYLWVPLHGGAQVEGGLLVHLGMSGSLAFRDGLGPGGPHDHFELRTSSGCLRLTDPRRFGAVVWSVSMDAGLPAKLLAPLGLEPFDARLNGNHLYERTRGRRQSIKQVLLSGEVVVGAGNIYACEALFGARIDPRVAAGRLSRPRCEALVSAVQAVLTQALAQGGSSLRDFKDAYGTQGHFQLLTQVYGRQGQPCRICATPVSRIVQGQRATFFCRVCQKR